MKKTFIVGSALSALALAAVLPGVAFAQNPSPFGTVVTTGSPTVDTTNKTVNTNTPTVDTTNKTLDTTNPNTPGTMDALPNPLKGVNSITDLIYMIIQVVVDISYVVIAFFLILSGFKFVTAQGSDTKLEEAKKTFFYTIIGALLVIGAQVIVTILQNIFKALK